MGAGGDFGVGCVGELTDGTGFDEFQYLYNHFFL